MVGKDRPVGEEEEKEGGGVGGAGGGGRGEREEQEEEEEGEVLFEEGPEVQQLVLFPCSQSCKTSFT